MLRGTAFETNIGSLDERDAMMARVASSGISVLGEGMSTTRNQQLKDYQLMLDALMQYGTHWGTGSTPSHMTYSMELSRKPEAEERGVGPVEIYLASSLVAAPRHAEGDGYYIDGEFRPNVGADRRGERPRYAHEYHADFGVAFMLHADDVLELAARVRSMVTAPVEREASAGFLDGIFERLSNPSMFSAMIEQRYGDQRMEEAVDRTRAMMASEISARFAQSERRVRDFTR